MTAKIIVANWKMNGSKTLLAECLPQWSAIETKNQIVVCPPFTLIDEATKHAKGLSIGGQDCHSEIHGAYTGSISASMLKELGCNYVILGHSERRTQWGESSALVQAKANAAIHVGITPIICVGETLQEYEANKTLDVLKNHVAQSCPREGTFVLAYEPLWAIGTGNAATPEIIAPVHEFLKSQVGASTPILYGGSVTAANAASFLSTPGVDGLLVGGASLKRDEFANIITAYVS